MDRYDHVPYGSRPIPEAHPDRLCLVARLFGLAPPDPSRAAILELGCGAGLHLASIAARMPEARCVGIDRHAGSIARATATADRLGASNAVFVEGDLTALDHALSRPGLPAAYDYVIAHGVYSWVPAPVRDALLAGCARWLTDTGIAYVSYNALPGWHLRGLVADMMRFHAAGFDAPDKQVAQSRALLEFLAGAVPEADPYGGWLRREARVVADQPDAWVYHDLLAEPNTPVALHTFVAHAQSHGLQYLGDADLPSTLPERLPAHVRAVLDTLGTDVVRAEQYVDFVVCRNFRRSLVCRDGARPDRQLTWPRLEPLWVRGALEVAGHDDDGAVVFRTRSGDTLSTGVPLLKAALGLLAERDPAPTGFGALAADAGAIAGTGDPARDRELIGRNLLQCFARGVVELLPRAIAARADVDERPVADPTVRALVGDGAVDVVPSLHHEPVRIDPVDRAILPLLDGTRSADQVVSALLDVLGGAEAVQRPVDRARLAEYLAHAVPTRLLGYARAGLLG